MANEKFAGRGTTGVTQYGAGRMFEKGAVVSTVEAIELAGMDDGLTVRPVTTSLDGGLPIETGKYATIRLPRHFGDKPEVLGINTADFTPLPNRDMAAILDASGLPAEWPVYSVGAFDGGKRAFYCYELPGHEIGGEAMGETIIFLNGHDGGRGLSMFYSNIRLECNNQTAHAEARGKHLINLRHRPSIARDLAIGINLIEAVKLTREQIIAKMNRLTKIKITDAEVQDILKLSYPDPVRGGKAATFDALSASGKINLLDDDARKALQHAAYISDNAARRALERRAAAYEAYDRLCSDASVLRSDLRGTGWALYNAVTEQENHRPDRRKDSAGLVFESIIVGDRAQTMNLALAAILN